MIESILVLLMLVVGVVFIAGIIACIGALICVLAYTAMELYEQGSVAFIFPTTLLVGFIVVILFGCAVGASALGV